MGDAVTVWAAAAAGAAALAVAAAWPDPSAMARLRLAEPVEPRSGRRASGSPLVLGAGGVAALLVLHDVARVLAAGAVCAVAAFAWSRWRADRHRAEVVHRRSAVAASLDLLAAEIRAGVLPRDGLHGVAQEVEVLTPVAAALRAGSDPVVALHVVAQRPGAEALGDLAAAWELAERAGVPLADVLERLAATVRDDVDLGREVRAEAAPARATGRLMAVLPVLGLGLGAGLGSDPLALLTTTVPGAVCLGLGAALACVGTAWIDRIADAAERAT